MAVYRWNEWTRSPSNPPPAAVSHDRRRNEAHSFRWHKRWIQRDNREARARQRYLEARKEWRGDVPMPPWALLPLKEREAWIRSMEEAADAADRARSEQEE